MQNISWRENNLHYIVISSRKIENKSSFKVQNLFLILEHQQFTMEVVSNYIEVSSDFDEDSVYHEKQIIKPFTYLTAVPGKNVRLILTDVLNYWLKVPDDKIKLIKEITHYVHNVSLLIDDIQDKSILRRGIPAAHHVFGLTNTIIAAGYIEVLTRDKIMELNHPKAMKIHIEKVLDMLRGQGMELYWRDKFICPTEEEYYQMVIGKTGGIFLETALLLELFSPTNKDVKTFLRTIALYFQINDDLENLTNQVYFDSKGFCEDLSEGKFGFPIIHAINTHPKEGEIILDILRQRTYDVELKKYCLSLIEKCGSFEYTRIKLRGLKKTLFEEVNKLGENPLIEELIETVIAACL